MKPFVLVKTAMSLDGCIDDCSQKRLILSSLEDKQSVDQLRSTFDAILVGAQTVRADNPGLLLKSPDIRARRLQEGRSEHPVKVTITSSGTLEPTSRFFTEGVGQKLVYCASGAHAAATETLGHVADVVSLPAGSGAFPALLQDLRERGIARLMVEGGSVVNRALISAALVDELRIAVAPFFLAEKDAPRVVAPGTHSAALSHRMELVSTEMLGDMAVLRYTAKQPVS